MSHREYRWRAWAVSKCGRSGAPGPLAERGEVMPSNTCVVLPRRELLIGTGALFMSQPVRAVPFEWTDIPPTQAGLTADLSARLDAAVAAGRVPNLHGVIVARGGRLALERYFA